MKVVAWSSEKDEWLRAHRGIGFEQVSVKIAAGEILDLFAHGNLERYPTQSVYVVEIAGYAYLVPFVESETELFLKTIIPSRKATKRYLSRGK